MASTYTPIATASPAGTNIVTFSSIPSTYTDLIVVVSGTTSGDDTIGLRYNSDSGSNYSYNQMYGNGTSAAAQRGNNETFARLGGFFATQTMITANIQNYSNSAIYKTCISRGSNGAKQTNATATVWRNTAAITTVTVNAIFGSYNSGTTISLYGIKAA